MNAKYFLLSFVIVLALFIAFLIFKISPTFNINTNQTAVIKEITELNRLETAQFTIEKIIDAKTGNINVFQEFLYGDQILLIAHGEVVAGFNLSKMKSEDVEIQGSRLRLTLPPPEILHTRIDNDKTKVYDRRQGVLTKGNKDLESEARKSAEDSIRRAACDADILEQATVNVKKQLKIMFIPHGFSDISIEIPRGNCQ